MKNYQLDWDDLTTRRQTIKTQIQTAHVVSGDMVEEEGHYDDESEEVEED